MSRPAARRVELRLTRVPPAPADAAIYVAGSFNRWNPADPAYRLIRESDGEYRGSLPEKLSGPIEFKFTLGSWQSVETDLSGKRLPNRKLTVAADGPTGYTGTVAAWRSPGGPQARARSTATASVSVLDHVFLMPELERTRRILIYLPPDYVSSGRSYPVVYMQDGQNVFDAATSFAGEWGVDETLDSLHAAGDPGAIVVGIENGRLHRMDEYAPWKYDERFGGEGDAYVDFLAHTLKPHIDRHYRTRPHRRDTAVAGSSMGGLISLYAALKHPQVFGVAGVFSASLWAAPQLYDYARTFDPLLPRPRLYLLTGQLEGGTPGACVKDQERMVDALVAAGFRRGREIEAVVREDGTHSEGFWRREFPAAYRWMFAAERSSDDPALHDAPHDLASAASASSSETSNAPASMSRPGRRADHRPPQPGELEHRNRRAESDALPHQP